MSAENKHRRNTGASGQYSDIDDHSSDNGYIKRPVKDQFVEQERISNEVRVLTALGLTIFFVMCNHHLCLKLGEMIYMLLHGFFGCVAYALPYILFFTYLFMIPNRGDRFAQGKIPHIILLLIESCCFIQLLTVDESVDFSPVFYFTTGQSGFNGGLIGGILASGLQHLIGTIATMVILVLFMLSTIIKLTETSAEHTAESFAAVVKGTASELYDNVNSLLGKEKKQQAEAKKKPVKTSEKKEMNKTLAFWLDYLGFTSKKTPKKEEEPKAGKEEKEEKAEPERGPWIDERRQKEKAARLAASGRSYENASDSEPIKTVSAKGVYVLSGNWEKKDKSGSYNYKNTKTEDPVASIFSGNRSFSDVDSIDASLPSFMREAKDGTASREKEKKESDSFRDRLRSSDTTLTGLTGRLAKPAEKHEDSEDDISIFKKDRDESGKGTEKTSVFGHTYKKPYTQAADENAGRAAFNMWKKPGSQKAENTEQKPQGEEKEPAVKPLNVEKRTVILERSPLSLDAMGFTGLDDDDSTFADAKKGTSIDEFILFNGSRRMQTSRGGVFKEVPYKDKEKASFPSDSFRESEEKSLFTPSEEPVQGFNSMAAQGRNKTVEYRFPDAADPRDYEKPILKEPGYGPAKAAAAMEPANTGASFRMEEDEDDFFENRVEDDVFENMVDDDVFENMVDDDETYPEELPGQTAGYAGEYEEDDYYRGHSAAFLEDEEDEYPDPSYDEMDDAYGRDGTNSDGSYDPTQHVTLPDEAVEAGYSSQIPVTMPSKTVYTDAPKKENTSSGSGRSTFGGSIWADRSNEAGRGSSGAVRFTQNPSAPAKQPEKAETKPYVAPSYNCLNKGVGFSNEVTGNHFEKQRKLLETITSFGVEVEMGSISPGPAVTRYELIPKAGVKVSRIVSLQDDIKLALAAADIRIEAPIPGKSAIGIEVPNDESTIVGFRDLIESDAFKNSKSNLAVAVGRDLSGKIVVTDLAKMPHLLIAGATGSGKSVCINTIIMSLLYKATPEQVKLIMIDPKVVELSVYNGIPHLLVPVVTDPKKASNALKWAVDEMDDRYRKFSEYNVRNLEGYNEAIRRNKAIDPECEEEFMYQMVIIVDELADLMMVAAGEVEESICRLAQKARAAGIHLVLATQRPSVNVITGLIKANVPSRIAFAVSSGVDSRTIIDMNGAEKLLGKGDMLFYPYGLPKPTRVQGAFISDAEVTQVVEYVISHNNGPSGHDKMQEMITSAQDNAPAQTERDELFRDVGLFVIQKDKGSIGALQRNFRIGFNRAARIMDQLAAAGVVGPEEGTKARKILMTEEEFNAYLAND